MKTSSFFTIALVYFALLFCTVAYSQQLISSESKGSLTKAQLDAQFGPFAQNGIKLYKITYTMPDLDGVLDTVSGLLLVPDRGNVVMPLLVAMHGTVDSKTDVPSNLLGGYELGGIFAATGYVTLMPDYLGLGESRGFHPYVHAASEAASGINMLFAVRPYLLQNNILVNNQLFLTGYSQGGHASMAMHQALERNFANDFTVTAAAHLSGPYSISVAMRELILSDRVYDFPAYVAYTILSYNLAYDLFDDLGAIFKPTYKQIIEQFLAGTISVSQFNTSLITNLKLYNGASIAKYMLQDSIINVIATNPNHPINQALASNDTYKFAAKAPTRLFYCRADDQVPFTNSIVADSVMNALGAVDVDAIDVNPTADHTGCIFPAVLNTLSFFGTYQRIQTDVKDIARNRLPIEVYPNPAADIVFFKNAPDGALLQVMDLSGKIQISKKLSGSVQVNLQQLPKGVYFAKIISSKGQWMGKVVLR